MPWWEERPPSPWSVQTWITVAGTGNWELAELVKARRVDLRGRRARRNYSISISLHHGRPEVACVPRYVRASRGEPIPSTKRLVRLDYPDADLLDPHILLRHAPRPAPPQNVPVVASPPCLLPAAANRASGPAHADNIPSLCVWCGTAEPGPRESHRPALWEDLQAQSASRCSVQYEVLNSA